MWRAQVRLWGCFFPSILTAWLFVANRVPSFERFAEIRNAIAVILLLLAALIPVARFRNSAKEIFPRESSALEWPACAITRGPFILSGCRTAWARFRFSCWGRSAYGLAAAILWLISMIRSARHHHHMAMQAAAHRRS